MLPSLRDSIGVITSDGVMIALAAFVIGGMIPATQRTFCWGIFTFWTSRTAVLPSTFDACKRSVAVAARVSVMLAPFALRYVILVSSR